MLEAHAFEIFASIVSILLIVNGFFVARLVKRIDTSNDLAVSSSAKVGTLEIELKSVNEKVNQLTDVFTRLREIERQIAVYDYILKKNP